ncbi:hypothetical protein SEA_BAGHAKAMALA_47 [Mycobacterium phage BaghaKamala]|nr:hypothetical protein SEA_BAGHAKAMALA_47 [Mycobacterium phage BaghaKamala]
MITLNHDEMQAAARAIDANQAEGVTTLGALAAAVAAVNKLRAPGRSADCTDCQRCDATCPGHVKVQAVSR